MTGTLVVHPGALGDVLLAVPALRTLRGAHPREPLTLAAQPRIGGVLRNLGVVDFAVAFDSLGLDALFVDDGARDHVRVVGDAARVVCWFGARDAGFARRLSDLAREVIVAPPASRGRLVWEHLIATAAGSHGERPGAAPGRAGRVAGDHREAIKVPSALMNEGRAALIASGWDGERPLLLVHAGAGGVAKRWPVDGFVDVIERLDATPSPATVVHEGPADHEAVRALLERLRRPVLRLDNPALPVLAGALAHVTAYIGNDSGISHLAAAVGVRAVVLFTSANVPWLPWSRTAENVTISTASLEPDDLARVSPALARAWRPS